MRGGKIIPLKKIADEAMMQCKCKKVYRGKRTGNQVNWDDEGVTYDEIISNVSDKCVPEEMNAEDPLYSIPPAQLENRKGLHTTGSHGICLNDSQYILITKTRIFIGVLRIGWVTGHSYIIYGHYQMVLQQLCLRECPTILIAQDGGK